MAQLYDYPTVGSGANQCIGILEFGGGFKDSDNQAFFSRLNLPVPTIVAVPVGNGSNDPGADTDADGEVALDIQVAGSIAPQARLAVYFSEFTEQGWVDAVSSAVHDDQNKPSVLSISWGFSEFGKISAQFAWTQQAMDAVDESFQAAAVMGVTICCAAGDDGSADQENDRLAHVDFPSSSPNVLACGGTRLEGSNGQITSEVVWNELTAGDGATGGGVSVAFPAVPPFQANLKPPPTSANPGHKTGRGVPDVAGNADPRTGFNIIVGGQPQTVGGTSAVAPLVAGLIALINQQLPHPAGFVNTLLYQNPTAFRDITSGNNGAYKAGPGWDACTGLGSPDGNKLLQAHKG